MEKIKMGFSPEHTQERGPWDTEKALDKERGVLEKFRGKAKDVARVLLFVSALSAGYGFGERTSEAGEIGRGEKSAHSQKVGIYSEKEKELSRRFVAFKDSMAERRMELENLKEVMYELHFLYNQYGKEDVLARKSLETWISSKTDRAKIVDPKVRFSLLNELHFKIDQFVDIFLMDRSREYDAKDVALQRESLIENHAAFRQLHRMYEEAREALP
ncbi:MAG: hypothetical protein Q7S34_02570 [bacterium]|nr:hypothetical protein [bacterium]